MGGRTAIALIVDFFVYSVRKAIKSTEQRQMEEIKRLQLEAKKKLKTSRRSFHRLAKGSQPIKAVKGSKRPTQIKEFHFSVVADKNRAGAMGSQSGNEPIDFAKTLRSRHPSDNYDPSMVRVRAQNTTGSTETNVHYREVLL